MLTGRKTSTQTHIWNDDVVMIAMFCSQPIGVLLHLPDGQQIPVEYDSVSTAAEVMLQVKARIGMRLDADGYGIFESCGGVGGWGKSIRAL